MNCTMLSNLDFLCELVQPGLASCSHLFESVGEQAVKDAKVATETGPHLGHLILKALEQDRLKGKVQGQAVLVSG